MRSSGALTERHGVPRVSGSQRPWAHPLWPHSTCGPTLGAAGGSPPAPRGVQPSVPVVVCCAVTERCRSSGLLLSRATVLLPGIRLGRQRRARSGSGCLQARSGGKDTWHGQCIGASWQMVGGSLWGHTPSSHAPPSQQRFPSGDVPSSRAGQCLPAAKQVGRHRNTVLAPSSAGVLVCLLAGQVRVVPVAQGCRFLTVSGSELL